MNPTQIAQNVSADLKTLYPFQTKKIKLKSGHTLSTVDEGQGPVVVLLHGNPTWSFFYRNLIQTLKKNHRVIAPDHLGMGLSDKPQDYDYCLDHHVENLKELLDQLDVKEFSMVVHDWGGAIGFSVAVDRPEALKKAVIMNTAAFPSPVIPFRINICRHKVFGEKIIRGLNGFAWPATFMAVKKPLSSLVKKGYLFPYDSYQNRIATARFVQDIPMKKSHPSFERLQKTGSALSKLTVPKLILWGEKDFCFNGEFLKEWQSVYPEAQVKTYPDAGHYLIEDETQDVCQRIEQFLAV